MGGCVEGPAHCLSPLAALWILCTKQFRCGDLIPGFSHTACYLLASSTKFSDAAYLQAAKLISVLRSSAANKPELGIFLLLRLLGMYWIQLKVFPLSNNLLSEMYKLWTDQVKFNDRSS